MKSIKAIVIGMMLITGSMLTAQARSGLGLRLTYDMCIPGDMKTGVFSFNTASGSGLRGGLVYTAPIVAGIYVEPGVMFFYDNYRLDELTISAESLGLNTTQPRVSKTGLSIPVMAGYQISLPGPISGLYLFTGPEFSFGFKASLHDDHLDDDPDYSSNLYDDNSYLGKAHYRRFTTSWTIGAAIDISRLNIAISGNIGISDQLNTKPSSLHENALRITVGYNF